MRKLEVVSFAFTCSICYAIGYYGAKSYDHSHPASMPASSPASAPASIPSSMPASAPAANDVGIDFIEVGEQEILLEYRVGNPGCWYLFGDESLTISDDEMRGALAEIFERRTAALKKHKSPAEKGAK